MKTLNPNGYIFVNLCSKPGHKRYQNVFEDTDEGKTYIYETDHPAFSDGLNDIENDSEFNSYSNESVELTYEGDEPTDADFEKFDNARDAMHKAALQSMIETIKERGEVEEA